MVGSPTGSSSLTSPRGLRAMITDSSSRKSTQASWISTGCPSFATRPPRGPSRRRCGAAPCRHSPGARLQDAGAQALAGALQVRGTLDPRVPGHRHAERRPGTPSRRSRCWVTRSTAAPGRTGPVAPGTPELAPARSRTRGDHVDLGGESGQGRLVVVVPRTWRGRHVGRGMLLRRIDDGSGSPAGPPPSPPCGRAGRRPGCRSSAPGGDGAHGSTRRRASSGASATAPVWRARQAFQRRVMTGRRQGQDGGREQGGVDRPGPADRQRAHGHAGRHLDDGIEAVQALERRAFDRHAQHRQRWSGRRSCRAGGPRRRRRPRPP